MARFRMLSGVGAHIQPDHEWEPSEEEKQRAERDRQPLRAPDRTYTSGSIIESDQDLAARFPEKFELIDGEPEPYTPVAHVAAAPHGQVSEGFQRASGSPGGTTSGPFTPKKVEVQQTVGLPQTKVPEGQAEGQPATGPGGSSLSFGPISPAGPARPESGSLFRSDQTLTARVE
jgi:hypothetical protein